MCIRAAQTRLAVRMAAQILGAPTPSSNEGHGHDNDNHNSTHNDSNRNDHGNQHCDSEPWTDNFNLCPGMEAMVFWKDKDSSGGSLRCDRKKWGLVPRPGTSKNPLKTDSFNQHFENLMYNARTDTLWNKATFRSLLDKGQTCVVAVDGYFEWKAELKGRKQPYFVHHKSNDDAKIGKATNRPFLLLPGLWTSVATGHSQSPSTSFPATLDTFTILTTEACPAIEWLHTRMPVCVWDERLALQWLDGPSVTLQRQLERGAAGSRKDIDLFCHPVTTDMTKLGYREGKAIAPLQRSSVRSFFVKKTNNKDNDPKVESSTKGTTTVTCTEKAGVLSKPTEKVIPLFTASSPSKPLKRPVASPARESRSPARSPPSKRQKKTLTRPAPTKKGSITSFFVPKATK